MGKIENLLLQSNGVVPVVMERVPDNAYEKFRAMMFGALNLGISLVSALLLGFYITRESANWIVAGLCALLWFGFYLLLAVTVQLGLRKEKGAFLRNILKAVPRVLLAAVLSLLITDPGILYFLGPDIKNEQRLIAKSIEDETFQQRKLYYANEKRKSEFDSLNGEKERLTKDLATKEELLNNRSTELNTQGTTVNSKSVRNYRASFNRAQKNYDESKKSADARLPAIEAELGRITGEIEAKSLLEAAQARREAEMDNGYIAQHKALFHLMLREEYAFFKVLTIILAALLIELTPLMFKVLSPYSAYEAMLDELQKKAMLDSQQAENQKTKETETKYDLSEIRKAEQIAQASASSNFLNEVRKLLHTSIVADSNAVPPHLESLRTEMLDFITDEIRQSMQRTSPLDNPVASSQPDTAASVTELHLDFPTGRKRIFYSLRGEPRSITFEHIVPGIIKALNELGIPVGSNQSESILADYRFFNSKHGLIRPDRPLLEQLGDDLRMLMVNS